jgi:hypothetical protein
MPLFGIWSGMSLADALCLRCAACPAAGGNPEVAEHRDLIGSDSAAASFAVVVNDCLCRDYVAGAIGVPGTTGYPAQY